MTDTSTDIMNEWEARKEANSAMSRDEFLRRFKARMLDRAPFAKFDDGTSVAEYADGIGPTYFDEVEQRAEGPEECADADMSYWGE